MAPSSYIYWTLMIGFMCGAIAKWLSPKVPQGDIFTTMLLGLLGSVIFGYIGTFTHIYRLGEPIGFAFSIFGAVLFLVTYHLKLRPIPHS